MLRKRSDEAAETPPLDTEQPKTKSQSEHSVIIYITILFTVVFLLTLLSYKMHQRESETAIDTLNKEHYTNIADLQSQITELKEELEEKETENAHLRGIIRELEAENEEKRND